LLGNEGDGVLDGGRGRVLAHLLADGA